MAMVSVAMSSLSMAADGDGGSVVADVSTAEAKLLVMVAVAKEAGMAAVAMIMSGLNVAMTQYKMFDILFTG